MPCNLFWMKSPLRRGDVFRYQQMIEGGCDPLMYIIKTTNMVTRARVELPRGLTLATNEFGEGWNLVRSGGAERLQRKIQTHGWNLIKNRDVCQRSGVGNTAQKAIASALKLALRQLSESFHAATVEDIHLTQYPWFSLARVTVHSYRILDSEIETQSEHASPLMPVFWSKRLPYEPVALNPDFVSVIPHLRPELISS